MGNMTSGGFLCGAKRFDNVVDSFVQAEDTQARRGYSQFLCTGPEFFLKGFRHLQLKAHKFSLFGLWDFRCFAHFPDFYRTFPVLATKNIYGS